MINTKAEKIDDISNTRLFYCSIFIFTGLIMVGRLLGNISVATNEDWFIGISGIVIIFIAFLLPMRRLINSINTYPKQKSTIVMRFIFISLFIFSLVVGLNTWAWSRDHSKTNASYNVSTLGNKIVSSPRGQAGKDDIILLRLIMTTLTYGSSVLYFALLYQPHEREDRKRNVIRRSHRKFIGNSGHDG